ncbi:hypothetical protein ERO13_1Z049390v2 [Gossypium hirsutum]|nr:hypothetical protein ERO13_1Z049390v2 [Gossypium hirsutum]
MKTGCVALVLCLNISVDPPDVIKISPCARSAGLSQGCLSIYCFYIQPLYWPCFIGCQEGKS